MHQAGELEWANGTRESELNYRESPLLVLNFGRSGPGSQVVFLSEPSSYVLCLMILDIILTCCAYAAALSLLICTT